MARERTETQDLQDLSREAERAARSKRLSVTILSFGYKTGSPPVANVVFDVRFLKNPYWVPELRPLTGLDLAVRDYVLGQEAAAEFLDSLLKLLSGLLPRFMELDILEFSIALGCTGGQHRSVALVEELADKLRDIFPSYDIESGHRELGEVQP